MDVLGVVPARAGSKGIKNKNTLELGGHPLLAWSIAASEQSQLITKTYCSTDSAEFAEIAKRYGAHVPCLRPKELAGDTSLPDTKLEAMSV